jgi:hypothetical protein
MKDGNLVSARYLWVNPIIPDGEKRTVWPARKVNGKFKAYFLTIQELQVVCENGILRNRRSIRTGWYRS